MTVALEAHSKVIRTESDKVELWREISNAWRQIARRGEKNISCLGICTTEFKILRILHEEGPTPMARLSDATVLTQPAITSFVDKLEDQGLVRRDRDHEDRRVIRIAITRRGRSLFRRGLRIHSRFVTGLLSELNETDLSRLSLIMRKISQVPGVK
ncbi:MAG TPA: MarR family transcriptional regulator [Nitrososphaerales archaeon]|nr:MarR family transcriptional regulator [Nitrososphaerales archaeon]